MYVQGRNIYYLDRVIKNIAFYIKLLNIIY